MKRGKKYNKYEEGKVKAIEEKEITNIITYDEVCIMTIDKALKEDEKEAKNSILGEVQQLVENDICEPIDIKKIGRNEWRTRVLRSHWIVDKQYNADGSFKKWKCRGCANPRTLSKEVQEYKKKNESYASPTATIDAININLHVAATEKRIIKTYDIKGAYLHGRLDEDKYYYMVIPKELAPILIQKYPEYKIGMMGTGEIMVKLVGGLYGLGEAGAIWHRKLTNDLIENGYEQQDEDPCVYTYGKNESKIMINKTTKEIGVVHVDDILCTFQNEEDMEHFEMILTKLYKNYTKHDIREEDLNYLGMVIARDNEDNIKVTMPKIVNELLEENDIKGIEKIPANGHLYNNKSKERRHNVSFNKDKYLSVLMKAMYIAKRVRYDILLPLSVLCTRVENPTLGDWYKLLRVLRYLNGTRNEGKIFLYNSNNIIRAYADASYNVHTDNKGHTGIIYMLGKNIISVKCIKQRLVTRSSTEAEIVACENAATHGVWLLKLIKSMGVRTYYNIPG